MTVETKERFKQSASTGLLIAFLTPIANADDFRVVTYAELSEAGHCDAQHAGRHFLQRAIIRIWKDHAKLFICVNDVGFKLATDAEISEILGAARRHIHKSARGAREKATLVKLEKLTNTQRLSHMANDAILGLLENSSHGRRQKQLEATFEKTGPKSSEADELLRLSGVTQVS